MNLSWQSTAEDRYGDEMDVKVEEVVESHGLVITDSWGGSLLVPQSGGLESDNGIEVDCSAVDAARLSTAITESIGYPVEVDDGVSYVRTTEGLAALLSGSPIEWVAEWERAASPGSYLSRVGC